MSRPPLTRWQKILGLVDSPIESILLDAMCAAAIENGYRVGKRPIGTDTIAIRPQQRVGRYRADFVVAFRFFGSELNILVECDGHDFHEKTPDQAARDKARDRYFTRLGYRVMRFTGREINRNPGLCAGEVLDIVMDFQTERLERALKRGAKSEVA